MAEKKERKTKCKVDLVSSHSERDSENGPLVRSFLEGSAVSELYKNDRIPPKRRRTTNRGRNLYPLRRFSSYFQNTNIAGPLILVHPSNSYINIRVAVLKHNPFWYLYVSVFICHMSLSLCHWLLMVSMRIHKRYQ